MVNIGYALSGEEHNPRDLVRYAERAEQAGFTFALISDHFHPWIDRQGHSVFVWSVIGGIAQVTTNLQLGTGVTCPTIRIHPAIIAQAAATAAAMMPGRFFLGVGTGENLNEHVLGDRWPPYDLRSDMLEEAIEVIRLLWEGDVTTFYGTFYTVENARIYTLPETLPPIMIAAGGPKAAELAGRLGDGLISTSPKSELVETFEEGGSGSRPRYGQLTVCWADDEATARKIAREWWPTAALGGELSQELPMPAHFEQATQDVTEEQVAKSVVCGNDASRHLEKIQEYIDAGFDHVYIHQVGPDQQGFFQFYEREILPAFR
ncbi:MAG: TIGR03557 family F420-dependent LLM class oxidoreductase [Chloroflexi bacterium]|jgi:G6PDH family F420-dependent oxidoreductase|nr:TIGR03557 family F420-dependent LLM class oxidoreductase [Chloroflexota bacterium]